MKLPVASGVSDLKQKMTILNRNRNPNRTYAKGSIDFDPDLDFDLLYYFALKQRVTPHKLRGILQVKKVWEVDPMICPRCGKPFNVD